MHIPKAESFKQLTISVEKLPASMGQHEALTSYAAERARLLLGCYRTGEANDPEVYVAAITATLAHFPEEVITSVTHPTTGLPAKKGWLPTVKEVNQACEDAVEPIIQQRAREKRIAEQFAAREAEDNARASRPFDLRDKYTPGKDGLRKQDIKTPDVLAEEARMDRSREWLAEYRKMKSA